MDLWNHSWDSCESLITKTSHRLCSSIVIHTKQSLPLLAISFSALQFLWGGENGWSLLRGHLPWSPPEPAPPPLIIFSHRWVSHSVLLNPGAPSPWHSTEKPLHTLGALQSCSGCSSQEDILSHLSLPLLQTPCSGPLPPLPPQSIPALMTAFLWSCAKVWKTWSRKMWCVCSYRVFTKYLQTLFKQLASTVRNNLPTGYLLGLLRGKKMLIILI